MNKNIVFILGAIIIIIFAAIIFLSYRNEETTPPPAPIPATAKITPTEKVVEITAQGFSPAQITIAPGTTISFINRDVKLHWPASGVHPVHQACPGFDALKPLQNGDSYTFTFNEKKNCPMHDHLNPTTKGTIIIE